MNRRQLKKLEDRVVIGLALVCSNYGGPEEGGWDYETVEPQHSYLDRVFLRADSSKATAYRKKLIGMIEDGDRYRGMGVGGCGDNDGTTIGTVNTSGLSVEIQRTWIRESEFEHKRKHLRAKLDRPYYE